MINKILSILALFGITVTSYAENLYTFKDSNGQVLLTDVVHNGKPAGETFQRFTKATDEIDSDIKTLSQQAQERERRLADLAKKLSEKEPLILPKVIDYANLEENWADMTDKQILQSVENPTDKNGNALELSSDEKQRQLKYAKEYIYERNLAKKPAAKIGMTTNQVRNQTNWGEPNYINKTVTAQGTLEQWVYDDFQYLYFINGKLRTIQTHE